MTMPSPIFPPKLWDSQAYTTIPIYRGVLIEKLAKVLLTFSQSEFPGNNAHSSNIVERIDKQRQLCPHIQAH